VRAHRALLLAAVAIAASLAASPGARGEDGGRAGGPGTGDAARGERLFARTCAVCHSPVKGLDKEGPSLAGVYGRRAGAVPFFANYRALRGIDIVWDQQSLNAWLADPRAFAGRDTTMSVKLVDPQDRADVIAYLKTLE
jgi:cytochrome c